MKRTYFILVFSLVSSQLVAEPLKYSFSTPTFGGNPLLGNYLMERAQIFRPEEVKPDPVVRSQSDYFVEQLQRRALSSLSSGILAQLQDPESADEGTYIFDDFTLSYERSLDSITITILEGDQIIEIDLPSYTFE